jgi:hypothetical protein
MAWELFRRDGPDGFEMMGVDGDLLAEAPDPALPLACEITIEAPSTLPEFIAATEAAVDTITDQIGGRVAGTSRTATTLWALIHLPSDEHAERFTQVPLPAKAAVSVAPSRDPEWTIFERVRPVDMEVQSMRDLRAMAELHAAGDTGGIRPIEHLVTGLDPDRSVAFARAVGSLGIKPGPLDGDRMILRHEADPSDITPDSWTLRVIAERHGAVYDGWRCDVVGASAPSRSRRRWRRR